MKDTMIRAAAATIRFLGLWLMLCAWAFTASAQPLRVVAWNIEWFPGVTPDASPEEQAAHMEAAQEALREIDPDIFIGQEIRDWQAFDELVSAVPGLRAHAVSSFRRSISREIGPQQVGIASKLKCRGAWWQDFKVLVPRSSRGFTFAALEHPETEKLIMVYGVHLKSNRGSDTEYGAIVNAAARNDQTRQLIAAIGDAAQAFAGAEVQGWIIGGDINTNHDEQFPHCRVVRMLENVGFHNTWRGVPREERLTWRSEEGLPWDPTTLDYFFLSGFGREIRAEIVEVPRELSDHYPILIELP